MPTNDVLALSPADAAKTLGIGRTNLYRLIAAGLIDARRLGGRTIIPATSLRDFLAGLPAAPIRSVSGTKGGSGVGVAPTDIAAVSPNTGYVCIAQHVHVEADALLISLAPELLEVLERIVATDEEFQRATGFTGEGAPLTHVIGSARALIAKARGETL